MADKNRIGRTLVRFKNYEIRLVKIMDKRTDNGEDRENVDPTWDKHTTNADGERCWSF